MICTIILTFTFFFLDGTSAVEVKWVDEDTAMMMEFVAMDRSFQTQFAMRSVSSEREKVAAFDCKKGLSK